MVFIIMIQGSHPADGAGLCIFGINGLYLVI